MHANTSGVIRREFEKREALSANGDDDAVVLQLADGALDCITRGIRIAEALVDFLDAQEAIAARAEKVDDGLMEFGALGEHSRRAKAPPPLHSTRLRLVRGHADALGREAAPRRADGFRKPVQHRLRAELVMEC